MGGLWVYRDDGTDMRVLGAIASARPTSSTSTP